VPLAALTTATTYRDGDPSGMTAIVGTSSHLSVLAAAGIPELLTVTSVESEA